MDLEVLVGGKWALWMGLLLVLLAASFGLAYGWHYIGPAGRVGLGVVLGLAFLIVGEVMRRRTEEWYGEGLAAGGVALLDLTLWAAAEYYRILPVPQAFAGMTIVTAVCLVQSLRYDSRVLILLASIGGFLTPVLLQGAGEGSNGGALYFWIYVTVLNAGILGAAAHKRWHEVNIVAFVATVLLLGGWLEKKYTVDLMSMVFAFLSANYLIFTAICSAYPLRFKTPAKLGDVVLLALVPAVYFAAGVYVLPGDPSPARGLFALGPAAICALLGAITYMRTREDEALISTSFGLATAFVTIALPMLLGGDALVMSWAAEAAVITVIGHRMQRWELTLGGLVAMGVSIAILAWNDFTTPIAYATLLLNPRSGTFAVVILATAVMARSYLRHAGEAETAGDDAQTLALVASTLVLWDLARETEGLFVNAGWGGAHPRDAMWFSILAVWAIVTAADVGLGLRWKLSALRWKGMFLWLGCAVAVAALSVEHATPDWRPFLNPRALAFLVTLLAGVAQAWALKRHEGDLSADERPVVASQGMVMASAVLLLWGMAVEVLALFGWTQWFGAEAPEAAWFVIFMLWAATSRVLFATGQAVGLRRLQGLSLVVLLTMPVAVALLGLATVDLAWMPFLNLRLCAELATLALLASAVVWRPKEGAFETVLSSGLAPVLASLSLATVLSEELYATFARTLYPTSDTWAMAAWFSILALAAVFAAANVLLGLRWRSASLRFTGLLLWLMPLVILVAMVASYPLTGWSPVLNFRALAFAVFALTGVLLQVVLARRAGELPDDEADIARSEIFALATLLVIMTGVAFETYGLFRWCRWGDPWRRDAGWLAILGLWPLIARVALAIGQRARLSKLQWLAVSLLFAAPVGAAWLGPQTVMHNTWPIVANWRLLGAILAAAAMASAVAWRREDAATNSACAGPGFRVVTALLLVLAASQEAYASLGHFAYPSPGTWQAAAWFSIAALCALAAVATAGLGFLWRQSAMRWTSLALWGVPALWALGLTTTYRLSGWPPGANFRALAFVVLTVTGAVLTVLYRDHRDRLSADEASLLVPGLFGVGAAFLALWELTAETFHVFFWYQYPDAATWKFGAHLGVSVVWTLYAAAWLVFGIARRQVAARWLSLSLFGLALLKVFLWDLQFLTLPFRVVSFGVLGLILIAVAWLYSRYGAALHERGASGPSAVAAEPEPDPEA